MEELFQGMTCSSVRCLVCGQMSNRFEAFTALSLDLGPGVRSVHDSLAQFTAPEFLEGANK